MHYATPGSGPRYTCAPAVSRPASAAIARPAARLLRSRLTQTFLFVSPPPTAQPEDGPVALAYRQFSYFWSTLLLIFAFCVVLNGIAQQWNNPPWEQDGESPLPPGPCLSLRVSARLALRAQLPACPSRSPPRHVAGPAPQHLATAAALELA